jgi:uncharacterized protein YceH (UPF0502 family)
MGQATSGKTSILNKTRGETMNMNLSVNETRALACLIEKAITTPDQYPLSLNALVNACNQKSNRDPVLELKESTVQDTVDGLIKKFLASRASGHGGRVTKYQHRFCNTEFGTFHLSEKSLAIICELFLRGPQTPGELRTRAERLAKFTDVSEVEAELDGLMARDEPLVMKLPREPGKREHRYAHLFSGKPQAPAQSPAETEEIEANRPARERLDALEAQVLELQRGLEQLSQKFARLTEADSA